MKRHVLIFKDQKALDQAVAHQFLDVTRQAVFERGQALVVLSGGNTPKGFFELLHQAPFKKKVHWSKIHFFWADERCVSADDPESNYGQAEKLLLAYVPVPHSNVHPVDGLLPPERAAEDYRVLLKSMAQDDADWPRFDWVLLGMGTDGHTASLFPGQKDARERDQAAIATSAAYQGRPSHRVSLTPAILNDARQVTLMVSGEEKAQILSRVLKGEPDPFNLPVQRIQPHDGTLSWMLTESAAKCLDP